eukprot:scaffold17651_cov153-Skeletonema_dohrnii-CCMP3373.AAC.2
MIPHPHGYIPLPIHFNGDDNECEGSLNRAIRRHDICQNIDASCPVPSGNGGGKVSGQHGHAMICAN